MAQPRINSIFCADFGSVHTRLLLIDIVDGQYRIVAHEKGHTTTGYPRDDVGQGLQYLTADIEQVTGQRILNAQGRVITPEDRNRNGVDLFIATASAGSPMRVALVGLMPDISLRTARRALSGTYIEPVASIHLRDGLNAEQRLNALVSSRPDVLFVTGGTDGGAQTALREILESVELALRVNDQSLRPLVIYAGNAELVDYVTTQLGSLTEVLIADNIRPSMREEVFNDVRIEIGKAFDLHRESQGAGFGAVGDMSKQGILPTPQSYNFVGEYFADVCGGNVMVVDVGSSSTTLVGVFGNRAATLIDTRKGLGHSAATLLEDVGVDTITDWLPFDAKPDEIENYVLNKTVRPASMPLTHRDLYLEHALLRAGTRAMLQQARTLWTEIDDVGSLPPIEMIIAGGSALTNTGNGFYDMLLIADCLQPTGITHIKTDTDGIIPPMTALARQQPDAVVQLLDGDALNHLGTIISVDGYPKEDEVVATLSIKLPDGETIKNEIRGGHLVALPLPHDYDIQVDIRLRRGYKIGGKGRIRMQMSGGVAGILIDARGRILQPSRDVATRATQMPRWVHEATDNELFEVPTDWINTATIEPVVEEVKPERRKRTTQSEAVVAAPIANDDFDLFAEAQQDIAPVLVAEDEDSDSIDLRDLLN